MPARTSASRPQQRSLGWVARRRSPVRLLDDPNEAVRIQAAQARGQLRVTAGVTALWRLATELSWWVRLRAREALEQLAPGGPPSFKLIEPVR